MIARLLLRELGGILLEIPRPFRDVLVYQGVLRRFREFKGAYMGVFEGVPEGFYGILGDYRRFQMIMKLP